MIGLTISHFKIIAELGRGGMGVVYRAEDQRLGREVAIKVLPLLAASDPDAKARFAQEARTASSLEHQNVCSIHDIGETDAGELFLVMPLYEGGTLRDKMDQGPMEVREAVGYARQIAAGLGRAHEAGIVHRDIKPDNLMVLHDGLVKILDFGVAKLGEGLDLTSDGSTVGTAAYMSPEQARGEEVDGRSDLWSIGVILYEALSGRRPFPGGYDQAVIYGILNSDPDPLSEAPEELAAVVQRLLEKDVDKRFQTAGEVADGLRPFVADAGSGTLAAARAKRRLVPAIGGAAIAAVLALLFLLNWFGDSGSKVTPDPALAVLPFDVQGFPEIAYLRQGLPTLISTAINGMGDLRAVDPLSVSSMLGDAPIDLASARLIAEEFGAEGVILGAVTQLGDEIRLQATIYDGSGEAGETHTVSAANQDSLSTAVDELTRSLIAGRFSGRGQTMASLSAITSTSFEALRRYMEGEELSRRSEWPAAYEAFSKAVEIDSTFVMPWYRMSSLSGWPGVNLGSRASDIREAKRHSAGSPLRVKMLVDAQLAHALDSTWIALDRWEAYLQRYPDDAHAWFRFGDLTLHANRWRGESDLEALPLLDRALSLDPSNREVAVHLMEYALRDRDWDKVDSLHEAMGDISGYTVRTVSAFRMAGDDPAAALAGLTRLAAASGDPAGVWHEAWASTIALRWPEVHVASIDSVINHGGRFDAGVGAWLSTRSLTQMGKLKEAAQAVETASELTGGPVWLFHAIDPLLYAPSADSAYAGRDLGSVAEFPFLRAVFAQARRDWPALDVAIDSLRADSVAWEIFKVDDFLALKHFRQGDIEAALELVKDTRPPNGVSGYSGFGRDLTAFRRWLAAELFFQSKRYEEATPLYESFHGLDTFPNSEALQYSTPAHRRLAEIAEIQGDSDAAIFHYEKFIRFWANADPELQPEVEEARQRLGVLLDARTREPGG